jgi:DNA ligase-1
MSASPSSATPFLMLNQLSERIVATSKRLEKMDFAGVFFNQLPVDELEPAALLLIGQPFPRTSQRTLDLDWSALYQILQELLKPTSNAISEFFSETGDVGEVVRKLYVSSGRIRQATLITVPLTIREVYETLAEIADVKGSGSRKRKSALLRALFARANPLEAKYLAKLIVGDQRIGFSEGMLESTIARTYKLPLELIRRANMLLGNIGKVALIAREEGVKGLSEIQLRPFTPLLPMLAAQAIDVDDALHQHGGKCAFEMKLDGARVQIHLQKEGRTPETRIYSRRLTDVTASLPEIVNHVEQEIAAQSCILEGEVLTMDASGRPYPFQHLMRRFRRVHDIKALMDEIPVKLFLFDLLMHNGIILIDSPYEERRKILGRINGTIPLVDQIITSKVSTGVEFFHNAVELGHEGLIAKRLDSAYKPGIRGKLWLKIKQTMDALDLVIIAAEWGTGRRHRWLSDYHLGARDPVTGEFHMLGKTFKGLTDAEFEEITQRLLELKIDQRRGTVVVKPQIVVEVEYDEIQQSSRYTSRMALRFARIKQIRYDKSAEDADTIQKVESLFKVQFQRKAPSKFVGRTPRAK